jgi:hypothetical protein
VGGGEVPGDFGGEAFEEAGHGPDLLLGVVVALQEEGGDLHPNPGGHQVLQALQDGFKAGSADLPVELLGEPLRSTLAASR